MDEGLTLREAYHDVVQRRPFISPNIGFWRQMIEFEEKLRGKSSVNLQINSYFNQQYYFIQVIKKIVAI